MTPVGVFIESQCVGIGVGESRWLRRSAQLSLDLPRLQKRGEAGSVEKKRQQRLQLHEASSLARAVKQNSSATT